ncbi:hypothetical protein GQ54DRAFT_284083 [Martensiomyces pterosporus]|nr:hypothetical protein GQ54DRAFT_284083 [Martensiomyces pterosporus]
MEFPDLGKNCTRKDCNRLDFLPFKCQYCKRPFCENHWKVEQHDCPQKHLVVDMRVPDCPLCGAVVSLRRGEDPNIAVDAHIRAGCKMVSSTPPAYKSNACAYKRCHDKVLVLTKCPYCQLSFCLKHRFEGDHDCTRRGSSAPPAANGPKTGGMLKNIVPMKKGVSVGPGSRSGGKAGAAKSKDSNCIIS